LHDVKTARVVFVEAAKPCKIADIADHNRCDETRPPTLGHGDDVGDRDLRRDGGRMIYRYYIRMSEDKVYKIARTVF
jgi:hypothetical protein